MRNNCLWEYLYCLKKNNKNNLTCFLRNFGPIFHCKLFWLLQNVYFLSMDAHFEHLPQILSGIEVWPRPPAGSGCPCPWFGSLSCCETQTFDETKSRVLQIISTCQHNSIFFFKPESGFLCTRLQNSPTAWRSHPPVYLWELCSLALCASSPEFLNS